MKYPALGEFKLQRAGSMSLMANQGDGRLGEASEEWLDHVQDAEERKQAVMKRNKTRVKANWEQ